MVGTRIEVYLEVNFKYDVDADAAYFMVADSIGPGEAVVQVEVEDERLRGQVILDLDKDGFLLGVEIVGASVQLRRANLK